jgi:hypothetical protein
MVILAHLTQQVVAVELALLEEMEVHLEKQELVVMV